MNIQSECAKSEPLLNAAWRLIDDAWEELQRRPYIQQQMGVSPSRLVDVSFAEAERRSTVGRSLLRRLETIEFDSNTLPHDLALSLRLARFNASIWSREAEWYWTVTDPLGAGFFGLFLPTAYCGGFLFDLVHEQFASFAFTESGDPDRYLDLVADYARLIEQFIARTGGQAARGVHMPKVLVPQARALLAGYRRGARTALSVTPQRLGELGETDFADELQRRIETYVEPAFDRAIEQLSDTYLAQAPEAVGLRQYPHGEEVYAELVKVHTTLNLTPAQIHARGLERMKGIETSMRDVRNTLGFRGDGVAFLAQLRDDPRWRASTVEGVTAVFQRYIDRLRPHLDEYFRSIPQATYGVSPLPAELQGSMTFGYYDGVRRDRPEGRYLFNPANLTKQALFQLGSLTYHELMPGHHLHLATQLENKALHPFRQHSFVNAYNEGWAEYAATLAGEMGLYEQPEERYGRLMFEALFTSRLVVDTGMNALGWPLERARQYMREHSAMTEAEVLTESVRYSCDIPGQALAYKLGDTCILALRERMRHAVGTRFQLKDFHAAILGSGGLPLPDLEWHVKYEIERLVAHG